MSKKLEEITADDVHWIVNDSAELGVEIGGKVFFLYKGRSFQYEDGTHDDGTPVLYRRVGKREFGETQPPMKFCLNPKLPIPRPYRVECEPGVGVPNTPETAAPYEWRPIKP